MENRFKDFPCLYFLDKRVDKKNNVLFYSMLASMFGQTSEQAAQTSKLLAHASGKLFNGVGFSVEEIMHDAGNSFTKPYKDCRGFYRRKVFAEAGLKDNCCLICPYSHSYTNNVLDFERQVLHLIIEHYDWIGTVGCSTGDFKSYLALSCTNDISEYPIIPFNALLFEYIMQNKDIEVDGIVSFVRDAMVKRNHIISETVLRSFVTLQLGIIERTSLLSGDDISSLFYAVGSLRENYYTPPQLVHLVSSGTADAGKRNKAVSSKVNNLVQLFQNYDNLEFIEKDTTALGKKDAVEELLQSMGETEDISNVPKDSGEEQKKVADDVAMDNLDQLLEFLSSTEDVAPINESDSCTDSTDVSDNYDEEGEATVSPENTIEKDLYDGAEEETSYASSVGRSHTSIQEYITPLEKEVSADSLETDEEEIIDGIEEENSVIEPCFLCHRPFEEKTRFDSVSLQALYRHCKDCEDAYKNATDKPVFSSPIGQLPVSSGCAFSSEKELSCIYSIAPVQLSEEFFNNIIDCSEFAGNLKNLVLFIEASTDAEHLSVECVQYHGIEGLLFYICGTYYFITGGYTTNATLKKLFSDAVKHTFYSMNPILVHVKLSHFGIRRAKIESLAVLYSVFIGTSLLFPPALFFNVDYSIDMYRSIMPQYEAFFSRVGLTTAEHERYVRLKKLEWGLASSVDISFISFGKNRSVHGSNALNYRFSLFESERLCREGMLLIVSLAEDSALPPEEAKIYWEDVVGRLASSSLSCLNYTFLLSLGEGVSYFTYFEEDSFYDSLMASARSAYKKTYKKEVHLNVIKEQFIAN